MQIVIDIPEKDYDKMCKGELVDTILVAIKNGTPLPKGHGRLVDCERLQEVFRRNVVGYAGFKQLFDIAPTIIDKSESEEKNEKRNC